MESWFNSWLGEVCVKHTPLGTLHFNDYTLMLKHNLPVLQIVIESIWFGNAIKFRQVHSQNDNFNSNFK